MSDENDFLWLEELYSEKSLQWVRSQNEKTVTAFQKHPKFHQFFEEASLLHSSDEALPFRSVNNGYVYHLEVTAKNPLGRWVRVSLKDFSQENIPWELLLDIDELSKIEQRQWYYAGASFSPKGEKCILSLSDRGHDRSIKREFDLSAKKFVTEGFVIPESKSNTAWFDEDTLLVGGYEESGINHLGYPRVVKIWRRGQELSKAEMLFEGKFEHHGVWAGNFEEKKCLIHEDVSWDEGKTYLFDHSRKLKQLHLPLEARAVGLFEQDVIFNLHKDFKGYKAGSVLQVSLEKAFNNSHQDQFHVIAQDTKESFIDGIEILKDAFLTFTLKNVSHELWHYKKESNAWKAERVQIPEQSTVTAVLEDAVTKQVFVVSENFLTPKAVYQLNADNSLRFLKKAKDIFTGNFTVQQNWAKSADGTSIPYFVVHKKDLKLDATHPTLLNAYGGFTISKLPMYMPATGKLWLEKGGIFVLANIRGGAEFGMNWHRSAILENKQKSYDDFIAVAEDLISRKYTTSERLGIRGGSNGGLLMGAVTTQRPDLFKAVLCEVPLLDMIRYIELPPGASWMDEYGDPRNEKMREVILKYSPYQNVHKEKKYPKIFFHTSITDDRVHPSHARRMAAKMLKQGHELFFYEESEGGHGSGDLKTKAFADALSFSYLWMMLG